MDLMNHFASYSPISTLERRRSIKSDISIQCDPVFTMDSNTGLQTTEVGTSHLGEEQSDVMKPSAKDYQPHNRAPIIDKLEHTRRIPETIQEVNVEGSPSKYVGPTSPTSPRSASSGLKNDIMNQIHEHSQNDTWMLRKLSQEFFGGQMKASHVSRLGSVPEKRVFQSSDSKLNQWASQSNNAAVNHKRSSLDSYENVKQLGSLDPKRHWSENDTLRDSNENLQISNVTNADKTDIYRKDKSPGKKLSLKKAFGIFDEVESYEKMQNLLKEQGKTLSASVASNASSGIGSQSSLQSRSPEGLPDDDVQRPIRNLRTTAGWTSRSNYERLSSPRDPPRTYEKLDSSRFEQWDQTNNNKNAIPDSPKKLKRTSSEQIRPQKERQKDILRDKHKISDPESVDGEKRHKNSDSAQYQASHYHEISTDSGIDPNRRISDPNSDQALSEFKSPENRWSTDSDTVFLPTKHQRRRDAHRRASSGYSTSSSIDERHKTSDPELKKLQQQALLKFYENKTGKRLSSSSIDSMGLDQQRISPKERYSAGSPRGWRDRSPSPLKGEGDRFSFTSAAMKKSKSLPRDMLLAQMSDTSDLDSLGSGSMERRSRSGSASKMDQFTKSVPVGAIGVDQYGHKKESSAPSHLESYALSSIDIVLGDRQQHRRSSSGTTDSSVPSTLRGSRGSDCSTPPASLHLRQGSQKSQVSQ